MVLPVNEPARSKNSNIINYVSIHYLCTKEKHKNMYNYQSPNNSEPQIGVRLHPESAMGNFTTRNEINDEGKRAQA